MQDYDRPGFYYASQISKNVLLENKEKEDMDFLLKSNLLRVLDYTTGDMKDMGTCSEFFGKNASYKVVQKYNSSIFNDLRDHKVLLFFPTVLDDFEFKNYDTTPEGLLSFAESLNKEGFSFNQEEVKTWIDFMNSFDFDYFFDENDNSLDALSDKQLKDLMVDSKEKLVSQLKSVLSSNAIKKKKP